MTLSYYFKEARDDTAVNDNMRTEIALEFTDPDGLNMQQIKHMDRKENVIDLAYKNKFKLH